MASARPFALLFCGLFTHLAIADPAADLARVSAFQQVDLASLAGGKVLSARGPALDFPRDLSVQALYLVHAPLPKALEMHKQWDSTRHPELKVYLHRDLPGKPAPGDFAANVPGNGAVRELRAATLKLPTMDGLQMSKGEAKAFSRSADSQGAFPPAVSAFWSQLLYRRATAFVEHGLSGLPPYDSDAGSIRVADEVSRLLREQPKVRGQFQPLIAASPLGGGPGASSSLYWELFDVEGQANFSLGAASSKSSGDTAQLLDLQYYASGGYYAFVTLYQMWSVDIGNRPATLVWRVDCISSLALSELHGMERMGSGAAMMKEILRGINLFTRDVSR